MTHDLLKLAEECEKREVHFKQWNDTLNEAELFHKLATALREAQAEIEKAHAIFGPDTTIEMLEEGLEARAELPKLRAELEIAREAYTNIGSERDMIQAELDRVRELITRDEITRIREEIKDATDSKQCSKRDGFIIFGYRCDCWKRAALEGK